MNLLSLESNQLKETRSFAESLSPEKSTGRKIESPFFQMILDMGTSNLSSPMEPPESPSFLPSPTDATDSNYTNKESEIANQKEDKYLEEDEEEEISKKESKIVRDENLYSFFSQMRKISDSNNSAGSDKVSKEPKDSSENSRNSLKFNFSENKEISKSQESNLEKFEKRILTSKELLEKLIAKSEGKSDTQESVSTAQSKKDPGSNSQVSKETNQQNTKEKNNIKIEDLRTESISSKSSERLQEKNSEKSDSQKEQTVLKDQSQSLKDTKAETAEKTSSIGKQEWKNQPSEKTEGKEKDVAQKISERDERSEIRREVSKWDMQKERVRAEGKSQTDQNASSNATKESIPSVGSNTSSQSFDSGKDQQNGSAMRNEFIQSLQSKDRTKEPANAQVASRMTKEEMKANFDRLVQTAKIQIINQGKSQAEIHMNPKDLGRMILKISVNKDKVEGKIMVDSESVKSALQADLSQLKEDLKSQGLTLQSLQIDVDLDHGRDFAKSKEFFGMGKGINKEEELDTNFEASQAREYKRENSLLDVVA